MGNEIPCCAIGAEQEDNMLLERAVRKGNQAQLEHDIRLARHNKLVNAANLSISIPNCTAASPFSNSEYSGKFNKENDIRRRSSKASKNNSSKNAQGANDQPRSILKPSSFAYDLQNSGKSTSPMA